MTEWVEAILSWKQDPDFPDIDWAEPPRPAPTLRPPRSRFWWAWRAFGHLFFVPARRLWGFYHSSRYNRKTGRTVYRFKSSRAVHDWLWGLKPCPRPLRPLRNYFYWLFFREYNCRHCGYLDFGDEIEVGGRTIEMFEFLEGGGVDYWGEACDAYGWLSCYRCGSVSWEAT